MKTRRQKSCLEVCFIFITGRFLFSLLVQSWFVPDEFWQTTEIAHNLIFGYGFVSWEWEKKIRSVLYPGIFAIGFHLLRFFNIDSPWLLISLPRFISCIIFTIGDFYNYKLAITLYGRASGNWTLVCLSTCWFLNYCASRTLSSCVEMTVLAMVFAHYPWYNEKRSLSSPYLWWGGIGCMIRPTMAISLLPLCMQHFFQSQRKIYLIFDFTFKSVSILLVATVLDSIYYQEFTCVPWNFLKFNVVSGISEHYGVHPWHWYLSQGLPVIAGIHLLPIVFGVLNNWKRHKRIFIPAAFVLFLYSCLPHKEFRFLLPILPILLCICGDVISKYVPMAPDRPFNRRIVVILLLLFIPNTVVLSYLGLIHQRGPMDVISYLSEIGRLNPKSSFLFLTPCHSTPLYSHMHVNVSVRFLSCLPNFDKIPNYKDEADQFFDEPKGWLEGNIFPLGKNGFYTHIIMFDLISESIREVLSRNNYFLCENFFNSHFIDGQKSKYMLIYCNEEQFFNG